MMKKCEKCGKTFEAKDPSFRTCYACHQVGQSTQSISNTSIKPLLLDSYYDVNKQYKKEVFIDIPKRIAELFYEQIKVNQLRDFHQKILIIRNTAMRKGFEYAKTLLWKLPAEAEYQRKRTYVSQNFVEFINHHVRLAEQNESNLEGFFQHMDCIVSFFPKQY